MKNTMLLLLVSTGLGALAQDSDNKDLKVDFYTLSLHELLNQEVITASNTKESLSDAPANTIVISQADIQERGYTDISELFDDLPGMDVIRPFGDTYYKNYIRGYRNTIGSPFIVMVDGIVINSLYFGITSPIVTMPISNIDKVEVVYGPTSSIYGANAMMGVVNIITIDDKEEDGTYITSKISGSFTEDYFTDLNLFYKKGKFRLSLSARLEDMDINNRINNDDFYWLKDEHYGNKKLWGDFTNNPLINPGEFSSYVRNRGVDIRAFAGDIEFGYFYNLLNTGYGTIYPGDKIPASSTWPRYSHNAFFRYNKKFNDKFGGKTLLRWRSDGITNDAFDLEAGSATNNDTVPQLIAGTWLAPGESTRTITFSSWQTLNHSVSVHQDFDLKLSNKFSIVSGIKYEIKNLQKAYDINSGPSLSPDSVDASDPNVYPEPPIEALQYQNRIIWREKAIYVQGKYKINNNHIFNLGARIDDNSAYGTPTTIRAGYVAHFNKFTSKLLYGEAYQAPVPRNLYGAWQGSGSDPDLKPEESNTIELVLSHSGKKIGNLVDLYYVQNSNAIVNFTGGAKNIGKRNVLGLEYQFNALIPVSGNILKKLKAWTYVSLILDEEESKFDAGGNELENGIIGDLAHEKIFLGITAFFKHDITLNLRGRYLGDRETVDTNPINKIDNFFILDGNLTYDNLFVQGLGLGIKVTNLLDAKYYHPGIRDADSGDPETFPNELANIGFSGKQWNGSRGWYNSKLPQPRRFIMLSLTLKY